MKHEKAYTLIELMIVVAIIGAVAAIGAISISSRIQSSRLETAAMSLSADLAYARSAALFKGCHTRIIFCADAKCSTKVSNVTSATHYAILRRAQYTDPAADCYIDGTDPSPSTSHFDDWDYDKTPKPLPSGVQFSDIYSDAAVSVADWDSVTDSEAEDSVYFHSSPYAVNAIYIPLADLVIILYEKNGSHA
ncbi:MAG: pilus assembly FimT family protein, partial [Bdellovibrionota bacterium]